MSVNSATATGSYGLSSTAATSQAQNGSTSAADSSALGKLNYQSFLQLLVAQMKNQDPTNPMDSSTQLAQLASFATVEQGIRTNRNLEQIISMLSFDSAASVIGKRITSADGEVTGIVTGFEVTSDGAEAILQDGSRVRIEPGTVVEEAGA